MNKTELRIGNIVGVKGSYLTGLVKSMGHCTVILYDTEERVVYYDDIEPVKLNTMWLESLGFQRKHDKWVYFLGSEDFFLEVRETSVFTFSLCEAHHGIRLGRLNIGLKKYVHEVQNFVYELIGVFPDVKLKQEN